LPEQALDQVWRLWIAVADAKRRDERAEMQPQILPPSVRDDNSEES
jgi:hypothetical protein